MDTFDPKTIMKLSKRGIGKDLMEFLAGRKRNYREISVDATLANLKRMKSSNTYNRSKVIHIFKELTRAHVGIFCVGRRSRSSRLIWSFPMIDVGKAALGQIKWEEVQLFASATSDQLDDMPANEQGTSDSDTIQLSFQLETGESYPLHVPKHALMTEERKVRLMKLIESLPVLRTPKADRHSSLVGNSASKASGPL